MTGSPTPVSGDAMDLVERHATLIDEVVAYLRDEADFNRSWTDGRRGPPDGADVGYRDRRLELAKQRDDWVTAIERLRSQGGAPRFKLVDDLRDEVASIVEQVGTDGLPGPRDLDVALDAIEAVIDAHLSAAPQPPVSQSESRTEQVLEDARTAIKIHDGILALKARVATEFARGVEAAVKIIERNVADYTSEHGSLDPETGAMEFSRSGEEYVSTLEELAEEIRTSLATGAVQPPEGGTGHDFSKVTRFEVIDRNGRSYTQWGVEIGLSVQDAGRTLKVFVEDRTSPPGQDDSTNTDDVAAANAAMRDYEQNGGVTLDEMKDALPRKDVEGAAGEDTIRLSCDCRIRQGEGFVHFCPAHEGRISAERSRVIEECAKWHDEQEKSWLSQLDTARWAECHRQSAAAIRDLGKQGGAA